MNIYKIPENQYTMIPADKNNIWHYNKYLKQLAKANRKEMTKAEACLWKFVLSSRQMMGYQFRRQRPILNYIADFMCKELMLIIEADGLTHQWEDVVPKDLIREETLESIGFKVIRFSDQEILNDLANVIRVIEIYIQDFRENEIIKSIPK